MIILIDFC